MSELAQRGRASQDLRRQFLATASSVALIGFVSIAKASDDSAPPPQLWIELGGQFDIEDNSAQTWTPPNAPQPIAQPAFEPFGRMPGVGYEWDGKITIQPDHSNWSFSASIQFGKSKRGPKSTHDQANVTGYNLFGLPAPPTYAFTDSHVESDARHFILDFQAGKDVGLGLFGANGSSVFNIGIRMAQFTQSASGNMTAQVSAPNKYNAGINRYADLKAERSFTGIGPSLNWNASIPLTGSVADGIAFDWGASAAILFGRQKSNVALDTKEVQFTTPFTGSAHSYLRTHSTSISHRRREIIVPNIGGFASLSYGIGGRGKISLGYRADFFFGAMDGGLNSRHTENVGFHGPFATISLGLGG